jgi:hypothetical protein
MYLAPFDNGELRLIILMFKVVRALIYVAV